MSKEREQRKTPLYEDCAEARRRAAAAVMAGGVVAFRTDTFYGLGANPSDAKGLRLINDLKGREGKPILILVSDAAMIGLFTPQPSRLFYSLSEKFWPGPLTLVVSAHPTLPVELTAGTGTIGVRQPDGEDVRDFVGVCGGGALTATSANRAGRPPARTAGEVAAEFPTGLAMIIDGGEVKIAQPSTVVDVRGERPQLIREGLLPWAKIEKAAG